MKESLKQKKEILEILYNNGNKKAVRKILKKMSWEEKFKLAQHPGAMIQPVMESFIENEFEKGFEQLPEYKQQLLFKKERNKKLKHKMYLVIHDKVLV